MARRQHQPHQLEQQAITSATTPNCRHAGLSAPPESAPGRGAPRPGHRPGRPGHPDAERRSATPTAAKVSAAASQGSTWAKRAARAARAARQSARHRGKPAAAAGQPGRVEVAQLPRVGRRVRKLHAKISSRIRALQRQQPGRLWRIARQAQPAAARHRHPPRQRPGHGHRLGQQRRNHPAMA